MKFVLLITVGLAGVAISGTSAAAKDAASLQKSLASAFVTPATKKTKTGSEVFPFEFPFEFPFAFGRSPPPKPRPK